MITLPFGKVDLVFMLLSRRLLLVRMIVGVVVTRCRGRSLFSPSTSSCCGSYVTVVAGSGRWICGCVAVWICCARDGGGLGGWVSLRAGQDVVAPVFIGREGWTLYAARR